MSLLQQWLWLWSFLFLFLLLLLVLLLLLLKLLLLLLLMMMMMMIFVACCVLLLLLLVLLLAVVVVVVVVLLLLVPPGVKHSKQHDCLPFCRFSPLTMKRRQAFNASGVNSTHSTLITPMYTKCEVFTLEPIIAMSTKLAATAPRPQTMLSHSQS